MKKSILITLFLLKIISLTAQSSRFKENETLNVWALKGINMRDKPDAKATKVATIPYGTKIVVQPNIGIKISFEVEETKGFMVKGYWLLVKYGNTEGFVFDGYLSRLPAPIPTEQDLSIETYLNVQIGKVGKKYNIQIFDKAKDIYRKTTPKEKVDETDITGCTQKYKYNIIYDSAKGEGGGGYTMTLPDMSLYEAYFLLKTYFYDSKSLKLEKKGKVINVTQGDGNNGCEFTIKQIGNNVVVEGYCGC
jgi:Bacterial SH3 domain